MNEYAIAAIPAPILNTPHFSDVFRYPLPLDSQNLLRAVEAVALPGTKFRIAEDHGQICKVTTDEYLGTDLYVDRRFLEVSTAVPTERKRLLPSVEKILDSMRHSLGLPYIWGGNWSPGIEEMLAFYPPGKPLDPYSYSVWLLKGLDCSGLLFEATQGVTPRNTSQLVRYGEPLSICGLQPEEIIAKLRPLDLIVWSGHVIVVENQEHAIESRHPIGVVRSSLLLRLREVLQERRAVDDWDSTLGPRFVVRRFA